MKKKTIPILTVCALIVIIVAIIGGSVLLRKYTPSKEHKGLTSYYNITADNQVAIVLNNELTSSYATLIDGHIYVDYNFVHDTLNSRFYWDHNENILLYATSRDLISAEADSNKYLITKSSVDYGRPVVKANSDSAYIDFDFVKEYTDLTYKYIKDPNRIIITNQWGDYETASVKKNSTVRVKGGIKSPILKDITETTDVTVIEQGDKWSKILTADGIIGYVQNKRMSDISTKTRTSDFTPDTFAHITKDFNI